MLNWFKRAKGTPAARPAGPVDTAAAPDRAFSARAPRVEILPLHDISFIPESAAGRTSPAMSVANISVTGAGIFKGNSGIAVAPGELFKGVFVIPGLQCPAAIRVMHSHTKIIGGRFEDLQREAEKMVIQYFNAEIGAIKMYEVNAKMLKPEPDGKPRWFCSSDRCELFVVESEGKVVRFNIAFFGNFFEGGEGKPVKYGHIIEDDKGVKGKGSALVDLVATTNKTDLDLAVKFVMNIEQLERGQRERIADYLRASIR
ncbi:MAG: hypothetical protein AB7P04_03390 [Bacteriovoracia bacterium]